MARSLKVQLLSKKILWRLSPCVLVGLARHFCRLSQNFTLDFSSASDFEKAQTLGVMASESKREYERFKQAFKKRITSLSLNDEGNKKLLVEAHLLGLAVESGMQDYIESLTGIEQGKTALPDYVVKVYLLRGVKILHQAVRMASAVKPKSYNYFVPNKRLAGMELIPLEPTPDKVENMKIRLEVYFEHVFGSKFCDIDVGSVNNQFFFDISHAGSHKQGQRTKSDAPDEVDDYVLQPIEYDTIIYDAATGDLRIHLEEERSKVMAQYVSLVSSLFFEVGDYWSKKAKYSLEKLRGITQGGLKALLSTEDTLLPGSKIARVRLCDLIGTGHGKDGASISAMVHSDTCLSEYSDSDDTVLLPFEMEPTRAKFAFDFTSYGRNGKTLKMNLTPFRRSYEGGEQVEAIDSWLESEDFNFAATKPCEIPAWIEKYRLEIKREANTEEPWETSELYLSSHTTDGGNEPS